MVKQNNQEQEGQLEQQLIERIRSGDSDAWADLIARYEGRLRAFVYRRLSDRTASEDVVQETFVGFLNSLPNYDRRQSLKNYLFTICRHKIIDHLRREGRRPVIPLASNSDSSGQWQFPGGGRHASSIFRSGERRQIEEGALVEAISEQVNRWKQKEDWAKLECIELLFVKGLPNKTTAATLGISEQQVANFKFDFLTRLRTLVRRQGLSQEVFPELYQETDA